MTTHKKNTPSLHFGPITTLDNGARIVVARDSERGSVAVVAGVAAGSRHERPTENGVAHFLEHMLFRGNALYTEEELTRAIDGCGGYLNATTDKEEIVVEAQVTAADGLEAAAVVTELVCTPSLLPEKFVVEQGVVLDEVSMYQSDGPTRAVELNDRLIFGDQSIGMPTAGEVGTVEKITLPMLAAFHRKHFIPSNIVVALTGNVTMKAWTYVRERLEALPTRPAPKRPKPHKAAYLERVSQVCQSPSPRAHLQISFLGPGGHETAGQEIDALAFNLIGLALGGYPSSRLVQKLRSDHGLCYSIGTYLRSYSDARVLDISAEMDPESVGDALELLGAELKEVASRGLGTDELERARFHLIGSETLAREDMPYKGFRLVNDLITREKIESPEERVMNISRVSPATIKRVAACFLDASKTTLLHPKPTAGLRKTVSRLIER